MAITVIETHTRVHRAVLSQKEVDTVLIQLIQSEAKINPGCIKSARVVWGTESYDSGLAKRPQLTVEITEDLTPP